MSLLLPRCGLVTDSTCNLSVETVTRRGVTVVPLVVVTDGRQHVDGSLTPEELTPLLRKAKKVGTSRPSPADFLTAYQQAAEQGCEEIVSLHLSSELSGTLESAVLAASRSPIPVEVVDSRSIGMGLGHAVLSAAEAIADGAGAAEAGEVARERADRTSVTFCVESLDYLRRGGRIGGAAAFFGTALAIKPLLAVDDGRIEPLAKVRTATRAVKGMIDRAVAAAEAAVHGADITVHQLDAELRADQIVESLTERCPEGTAVDVVPLGAVAACHVGPGTTGVVVAPRLG